MRDYKLSFTLILCLVPGYMYSAEWSHMEIRATGKNLISMAAFYTECGRKEFVKTDRYAIRWASFMGSKYLIVAGIEREQKKWIKNGTTGILIEDPNTSEKTMKIDFSKEFCVGIKYVIDTQYQIADNYLSGKNKNP